MNEVFLNQNHDTCTGGKGLLCTAVKTGSTATTASFTYTPWGQIATRKDKTGTVTDTTSYAYDGMGRLTTIGYPSRKRQGHAQFAQFALTARRACDNRFSRRVCGALWAATFPSPTRHPPARAILPLAGDQSAASSRARPIPLIQPCRRRRAVSSKSSTSPTTRQ